METRVLTADVPLPLAERLNRLARQLERPTDAIVREALDAWIAQEEQRHRLTLEGLADVAAGLLVDVRTPFSNRLTSGRQRVLCRPR